MRVKNSSKTRMKTTKMKKVSRSKKVWDDLSFSKYALGAFEGKEGDYEIDDEMYDTEGMFDDYMGLDGKQDDEGMLDNAKDNNNSELWFYWSLILNFPPALISNPSAENLSEILFFRVLCNDSINLRRISPNEIKQFFLIWIKNHRIFRQNV